MKYFGDLYIGDAFFYRGMTYTKSSNSTALGSDGEFKIFREDEWVHHPV